MAAKQYTPPPRKRFNDGHPTNGSQPPDRGLFRPALTEDDSRLARIRRKPSYERRTDEVAYERGAAIAADLPFERASGIAGLLHDLPAMQSTFVLIGGVNEQGHYRWASAVVDFAGYFGGQS